MSRPPYLLTMPEIRNTASIFASPHSGRKYPWHFIRASQLDEKTIRSSEDAFVDQLFSIAPEFGAPLLSTAIPRAYVDLNRAADELDPALITGARQKGHNPRISSGLGVIPRVVANGREIRHGKISLNEARGRLDAYYHPYHDKLKALMVEAKAAFGLAILLDCHSMPHDALTVATFAKGRRPEIVLGDRFGTSCAPEIMDEIDQIFKDAGLRTSRNMPFAGAYVTQNYGRPTVGHHTVQIEIDRALYLDQEKLEPSADFEPFKAVLGGVVEKLAELGRSELRLAAE